LLQKNVQILVGVAGIIGVTLFSLFDWMRIGPKPRFEESLESMGFNLFRLWDAGKAGESSALKLFFGVLAILLIVSLALLVVSLALGRRPKLHKAFASAGFALAAFVPAAFMIAVIITPFGNITGLIGDMEHTIANSEIQFFIYPGLLFIFAAVALILARMEERKGSMKNRYHNLSYHAMLTPAVFFLIIFNVIPIFGLVIAFKNYQVAKPFFGLSSDWSGLKNFEYIFFRLPDSRQVIINTVIIAVSKIIGFLVVPVAFALLLNECRIHLLKSSIQTLVYLPNFLSWVTVGLLFRQMFSPIGLFNTALLGLGVLSEPVSFITSNTWFRPIIVFTDIWKGFGYSAVIYIAAITSVDMNLYEAAAIDGAGRWKQMRYITVPGILSTIVLMGTLSLGNILNAGFDQVFNMITLPVRRTGDILDTYIYRIAIEGGAYHRGTAMGMAKSVISMLLIMFSYKLADKYAGYRIF